MVVPRSLEVFGSPSVMSPTLPVSSRGGASGRSLRPALVDPDAQPPVTAPTSAAAAMMNRAPSGCRYRMPVIIQRRKIVLPG